MQRTFDYQVGRLRVYLADVLSTCYSSEGGGADDPTAMLSCGLRAGEPGEACLSPSSHHHQEAPDRGAAGLQPHVGGGQSGPGAEAQHTDPWPHLSGQTHRLLRRSVTLSLHDSLWTCL